MPGATDNYVANPGTGGETFASDSIGSVHIPRVKPVIGADGSATDVSAANPMPCSVTDGANVAAVKPANTAATTSDPAVVVTVSPNTGSMPVNVADYYSSGNITAQNSNPTGTPSANSAVSTVVWGKGGVAIQVEGTYTGVLSLQGRVNNSGAWVTLSQSNALVRDTGVLSATIPSAATGIWQADVAGYSEVRVTALAAVTGTATVSIRAIETSGQIGIDSFPSGVTVDTELPAAAALADAAANPTTPLAGAAMQAFNGATWDRFRNNVNTTTGDTGTKLAAFNGATQTNHNARGAIITVSLSAATSVTTLSFQLQYSPDGSGTKWINIPGAVTANITAAGDYALRIYPGLTAAANAVVSDLLPRTWRVVVPSFAGTSFIVSAIYVNYLL